MQEDLVVHQMDVTTAYLNAPIDTEVYMEQPEGYEKVGKNGEKLVYKLQKYLYGLKQSGSNWNNALHTYLLGENFQQSLADPCVYHKNESESKVIVIVWVDDIIIGASNEALLNNVKSALNNRFKMKDMGQLAWFLGIEFKCNGDHGDSIEMNQTKYLEKLLRRFNMADCKPKVTPCDLGANKIKDEDSVELEDPRL